ncbi:hypothetical protein GBK02_10115 [Dechloromonas sp. TW-R-39-2]|uniref:protein YgfX n=1 Tax=Dechloromonas sp. TW-R-39-2 TaxID=2654218 RepID=UPI00193D795A|nr:protein YgfX [Dechloromonas sp. TW-R-39-2]QRM19733.1 hypothetical protein GBK02_10115 [Dechloromonas sp. TW-R-39-2]
MQLPITIGLHRSRFIGIALQFTAVLAGITVFLMPVDLAFRLAGLAVIGALGITAWRCYKTPIPCIRLEHNGDINLLSVSEAEAVTMQLLPGAIVHPWLTVFRLKSGQTGAIVMIATVDSLDKQNFRRLRTFLRWRASFNAPSDDA